MQRHGVCRVIRWSTVQILAGCYSIGEVTFGGSAEAGTTTLLPLDANEEK
jgi:hypothetical protein